MRLPNDQRLIGRQGESTFIEFYREEFIKHQRLLRRQREFYSETAVNQAEEALARILSELPQLCSKRDADIVVSKLLRQFDTVTGLSAWTDPKKAH